MIWNLKTTNTGMMRNKHVDKNEDNNESKNIVVLIGEENKYILGTA